MFKTILAPVDGSDSAAKALALAADLAQKYEAKLIVAHVTLQGEAPAHLVRLAEIENLVEPIETPKGEIGNIPAGVTAALQDEGAIQQSSAVFAALGRQVLGAAERSVRQQGVDDLETRLLEGDPAEEILKAAEAASVDAVVMGSRGLSDLKGLLLGSVSHKVSSLAPCTCITVK